jgi:histidinol-phosphate aminotransferase
MTAPRYRWQPTTDEIAARNGLLPRDVIRFDHNTSPFTTDWAASIVAPIATGLNEYPGASYAPLRSAAASFQGTKPENIVPGAGVDEIILLVARAFLSPSARACTVGPTYPLYEIATKQMGAEFVELPFVGPGFGFPHRAFGEAAETSDVAWMCVPNNPTGHRITDDDISSILAVARGIVVIDAAYAEFVGDRWAPWVERHDNLIVCSTMSKAFGLAALRVGFAMASPDLTSALDGVRPPGSISTLSAEIATSALETPQRMERHVARILRERARFADALGDIGLYAHDDMAANFVLCEVGPGAPELAAALMREGLVVRQFPATHLLGDHLRFTVRSRDEDDRLIDALRRLTS